MRSCRQRPLARAAVHLLPVLLAACGHVPVRDPRVAACRAVLQAQVNAWNRGDIDGYAAGYGPGPDLVFMSPSGVRLGHAEMVARYKQAYPDRRTMGKLVFRDLAFEPLGRTEIVVRGTWRLERATDAPWGRFLLVMRELPAGWRVVLDYTTSEGS